jgi:hypothetical protein
LPLGLYHLRAFLRRFAPWLGLRLVLGTPRGFLLGLRLRVLVGLLRHVS